MRTFYCLYETLSQVVSLRIEHLKLACEKFNINFVPLNSITTDYSNIPRLNKEDFLYNVARGSKNLESLLINEFVTTFYIKNPVYIGSDTIRFAIVHFKANIPMPISVFHATNNREKLKTYVKILLGFPVILKVSGGTLGIGTMIVNNYASLFSLTDYLISIKVRFMLRQFIKPKEVARLIVVGDKVVASNQKFIAQDDFRTSIIQRAPLKKIYPQEVRQLAIAASHLVNFENSGVDIVIDENNKPYLLEVNMPHDFVTTEEVTKIDIASIMVEYLIKKSAR